MYNQTKSHAKITILMRCPTVKAKTNKQLKTTNNDKKRSALGLNKDCFCQPLTGFLLTIPIFSLAHHKKRKKKKDTFL